MFLLPREFSFQMIRIDELSSTRVTIAISFNLPNIISIVKIFPLYSPSKLSPLSEHIFFYANETNIPRPRFEIGEEKKKKREKKTRKGKGRFRSSQASSRGERLAHRSYHPVFCSQIYISSSPPSFPPSILLIAPSTLLLLLHLLLHFSRARTPRKPLIICHLIILQFATALFYTHRPSFATIIISDSLSFPPPILFYFIFILSPSPLSWTKSDPFPSLDSRKKENKRRKEGSVFFLEEEMESVGKGLWTRSTYGGRVSRSKNRRDRSLFHCWLRFLATANFPHPVYEA